MDPQGEREKISDPGGVPTHDQLPTGLVAQLVEQR